MKRFVACLVASLVAVASVVVGVAGSTLPAAAQTPPVVPEPYIGVTPVSVLEPVAGGAGGGPMAANDVRTLTVAGVGGVPSAVEAVDLTLTAVRTTSGTDTAQVFVGPAGSTETVPVATLRGAGTRQTTTVTVAPSTAGAIDVRVDKALDVEVAVRGYYPIDGGFVAAPEPVRLLGIASGLGGGTLQPAEVREIGVLGIDGIPDEGVSGIVARLTIEGATSGGRVEVAPAGAPALAGEAFRFTTSLLRVGSVAVGLGEEGRIQVTSNATANASLYVDGWFDDQGGYTPVAPTLAIANQMVTSGGSRTASVASSVPATGVAAVALQVTATGDAPGLFTIEAGTGQSTPALSVSAGGSNSRNGSLVWTPVRSDGSFDVTLSAGTPDTRVTVVVMGWTAAATVGSDTTEPTASVESPTPGPLDASESGSFTMVVAAADAGSGVAGVEVTVAGVTTAARYQTVGTGYRWVAEVLAAESGLRDYVVTATDRAGNTRTITATYTLTAPAAEDTVLDPDTTVVDETVGELTAYDPGTGVMTFDGDVSDTMHPGQILASDPTDLAPNGYLRVVTGVIRTGSTTTVHSRQAMVTEAVRQVDVDVSLEPDEGVASRSTAEVEFAKTFSPGFSLEEPYSNGSFTSTLAIEAGLEVSVGLRFRLEIDLNWLLAAKVTYFEVVAQASVAVTASETITGEFSETVESTPFFDVGLGVYTTPIPGLVITPSLELRYDAAVSVGGSMSASFTTGKRIRMGVIYEDGEWDTIAEDGDIGGGFTIQQEAGLEYSAEAGIAARFNVAVNDTVGLYLEARAAIEVSGALRSDGTIECAAQLGITVTPGTEIQFPVIDATIFDVPFGEFPELFATDLFNISCPNGEEVGYETEGTEAWVGEVEVSPWIQRERWGTTGQRRPWPPRERRSSASPAEPPTSSQGSPTTRIGSTSATPTPTRPRSSRASTVPSRTASASRWT